MMTILAMFVQNATMPVQLALDLVEVNASHVFLAVTECSILVHVFVRPVTSTMVHKHAPLAITPVALQHAMVQAVLTASPATVQDIEPF